MDAVRGQGGDPVGSAGRLQLVVSRIDRLLLRRRDAKELLDSVCRLAVEDGGFAAIWIGLVDGAASRIAPVAAAGLDPAQLGDLPLGVDAPPSTAAPAVLAALENRSVVISGEAGRAAFPIRVEGQPRGVLEAQATGPECFGSETVGLLEELAADIGYALDALQTEERRGRAERALQEEMRHSQSLLRLSRSLEFAQTYAQALKAALEEVRKITGYGSLWAYLLSEDGTAFDFLTAEGLITEEAISSKELARLAIRGDRMLEEIARATDVVIVRDARVDERTNKELVARFDNRTLVHVPVFLFDRRLGAISTGSFGVEGVHVPTDSEREYLTAMASHMAVALDRIRLLKERTRAEEALRQLNEKLEWRVEQRTRALDSANRELETFVYSVAHDLQAPLTSIDAFSGMLASEHGQQLAPDALECVDRIRGNTRHLQALIGALLELAKLSRCELRAGTVDLSEMARQILDELRRSAPDRPVEAVVAPGLVARADPVLLRTVLVNLLGNALKYSAPRAVARLEVGARDEALERSYFVRDNGVGFDMGQASNLFAPFHRLHSPTQFPGSGIGLVSVKRVISRHGGRVWAESEPDRGATFWFTLASEA